MFKTFSAQEVIFNQGDAADTMYEVTAGSVGIFINYGKDDEKMLTKLTKGSTFGEMGMIENLPRSATAVSMEANTRLQVINADSFVNYFQDNPAKVLMIMKHMSGRIRALTNDYLEACRAVAESEEATKTGKKSNWLREHAKRFVEDYARAIAQQDSSVYGAAPSHYDHYFF